MLRLNKLTDYAIVILGQMARIKDARLSATALAAATGINEPTVAKILKDLGKAGMVTSVRGAQGGYVLNQDARILTVHAVIEAIEGPTAIADCVEGVTACCAASHACPSKGNWDAVNTAIIHALDQVTLHDMIRPQVEKTQAPQLVQLTAAAAH